MVRKYPKVSHNNKKKRNQNKQILIEKLNDAADKEDHESSSSYFHVNELNNNFFENDKRSLPYEYIIHLL